MFLKKLKTELPYDPAIPLLGIYPGKNGSKGYMHPIVHCSAVYNSQDMETFICALTDEWIKKIWYIYTMEYYSAIKKNEIMPFTATWMDLEIIILSEVSQTKKDKYHMISLICRVQKKMIQTNLFTKQRQTHRLSEQTYGYQRGSMEGRDRLGIWD